MPERSRLAEWIESYRLAWENADSEAAASLFTEDASYRSNIFENPHVGRRGIDAYWSGVTASQTEVTVRMGSPVVDGERVVVEFWTTMRVDGDPVTLPGCLLLRFSGDSCSDLREYWQILPELRDPPPDWGS